MTRKMDAWTNVGEDAPHNVQFTKGQDIETMKTEIDVLKYCLAT